MPAKQLAQSNLSALPDTYFYTLARTGSDFATIGSDDALRIFNIPDLKQTRTYAQAHSGISCLTTASDGTSLFTAGRDGLIRLWDPRTSSPKPTLELREPKGAGFSALACTGTFLAAGTESAKEGLGDVSVLVYDLRSPGAPPMRSFVESHTDSITQLQWHPTQRNLLLSGSTDGLVSVFDAEVAEEEDALMQVLNPRSAVHCAGFLAEDQVFALSTDEQLWVYGLEKTGTADEEALPVKEFGDVRGELDCMYVIDLAREAFLPNPIVACGHNEKQTLRVAELKGPGWELGEKIEFPGAHGEEVVRDLKFVDAGRVVSCGEDGIVRLWSLGEAPKADGGRSEGSVSKKAKRKASLGPTKHHDVAASERKQWDAPRSQRLILVSVKLLPARSKRKPKTTEKQPSDRQLRDTTVSSSKRKPNTIEKQPSDRQPREATVYLPECVVRKIPKYEIELDEVMAAEDDEGQVFEIQDMRIHPQVAFHWAIGCISGSPLPKIDDPSANRFRELKTLLGVYAVSIELESDTLERAVLDHLDACPSIPTEMFLDFARLVYSGDEHEDLAPQAAGSSIGRLIKRKLAIMLPQLLQNGIAQKIKAEGGPLSTELLQVMIDHYSGKHGIKTEG
ncbi:hypothetical protein Q7P37_004713 [Cladosporium fusiforme]